VSKARVTTRFSQCTRHQVSALTDYSPPASKPGSGHIGQGRITLRLRDASYKGHIVQKTHRLRLLFVNTSVGGHVVLGSVCHAVSLSTHILVYIFLACYVCWPLLCLCRPFGILERCLDSSPDSCRTNSTYSASTGSISVHTLTGSQSIIRMSLQIRRLSRLWRNCDLHGMSLTKIKKYNS
jgi:hypothetical protein